MITLLLATRNDHKVAEIRALLGEKFCCRSFEDFPNAPEVVEDAGTFAGNATKKAVALARWLATTDASRAALHTPPFFALADDSGLEVDALDGAPGVHSARFAALDCGGSGNSKDADNNAKLLRLLATTTLEKRTARFQCVLALTPVMGARIESASPVCYADEYELASQLFEGACEGRIRFAPAGQGGFGYDPLFVPDGFEQSFAELGADVKNVISHRAKALGKLKAHFQQLP